MARGIGGAIRILDDDKAQAELAACDGAALQLPIASIYLTNQVLRAAETYLRDVVVEISNSLVVKEVVYKIFCLDAVDVIIEEQTVVTGLACRQIADERGLLFELVIDGQRRTVIRSRHLRVEAA